MRYLFRKTRRDLWNLKTQFISVLLMSFFAVFIFTGLEGVYLGMLDYSHTWFQQSNTADAWVNAVNLDNNDINDIKSITEIARVQPMAIMTAELASQNDVQIQLMASDQNSLSKPIVTSGATYNPTADGIWLFEDFAREHSIKVGDHLQIKNNNKIISLTIKGLVLSPEHLSYTGSQAQPKPDHFRYGYGYISPQNMQSLADGELFFNQIKISYFEQKNMDEDAIANVRTQIEDKLDAKYISYSDRTDFKGISSFIDKFGQIKKMAMVFSILLILLCMLCIQTTMKRMIETQRIQIGTLKAIGYSNTKIRLHYLCYGFWISLIGGTLGLLTAPPTISTLLLNMQKQFYSVPEWHVKNSWGSIILLIAIITICSLSALLASRKGTKGMPAITMRNELPKANGQIFLEHFTGLWDGISYGWKWTLRVTARNKTRTLMGVVGIIGSVMLLMASIGMYDSLTYANKSLYGTQFDYTSKVIFTPIATAQEKKQFLQDDANSDGQWLQEGSVDIRTSKKRANSIIQIYDSGNFTHFNDINGNRTALSNEGISISRKLANDLGLQENDTIQFRLAGQHDYLTVPIDQIITPYSPQGLYLTKAAWENLKQNFTPNALLVGSKQLEDNVKNHRFVKESITLTEQLEQADDILSSVTIVIVMLMAGALLLSIIILYNLGILSFTERSREYATLKVIGYRNSEIKSVIRRDSVLQLFFGLLIGFPVGLQYLKFYVKVPSTDSFEYTVHLGIPSILLVLAIICTCTYVVSLVVSRKALQLNMIEALKSIE